MTRQITKTGALLALLVLFAAACRPAGGEHTGTEYMPDMGHSIAYESNVLDEYSLHDWNEQSVKDRYKLSQPRYAVEGTIARGALASAYGRDMSAELEGRSSLNAIRTPINGNVPYYYKDTEEERTRAMAEIQRNPFPITSEGIDRAKWLYETYCGICHGNDGGGAGYLVSDDNKNAKYPAQPANFLQDVFYKASNGRYYHAIMYGKNVMGGYADKLTFEERWQVIHYIHALQAKAQNLEYNASKNTFTNSSNDVPAALVAPKLSASPAPPAQDAASNGKGQGK
jgi:mono/diheme cytochrome c family protein